MPRILFLLCLSLILLPFAGKSQTNEEKADLAFVHEEESQISFTGWSGIVLTGLAQGYGLSWYVLGNPHVACFTCEQKRIEPNLLITGIYAGGLMSAIYYLDKKFHFNPAQINAFNLGSIMGSIHGLTMSEERYSFRFDRGRYPALTTTVSLAQGSALLTAAILLDADKNRVRAWQFGNIWGSYLGLIHSGLFGNKYYYSASNDVQYFIENEEMGIRMLSGAIIGMLASDFLHQKYPKNGMQYFAISSLAASFSMMGGNSHAKTWFPQRRDFAKWGLSTLGGLAIGHLAVEKLGLSPQQAAIAGTISIATAGTTAVVTDIYYNDGFRSDMFLYGGLAGVGSFFLSAAVMKGFSRLKKAKEPVFFPID